MGLCFIFLGFLKQIQDAVWGFRKTVSVCVCVFFFLGGVFLIDLKIGVYMVF